MSQKKVFHEDQSEENYGNEEICFYDVDDSNFISQFLDFKKQSPNKKLQENIRNHSMEPETTNQPNKQASIRPKLTESNIKKYSNCHNYQKHLVRTLQRIIDVQSFEKCWQSFELESKLWKCFHNGKRMNKTLISLTLISMQFSDKSETENQKIIKKYGFEKIVKNHSRSQIRQAQKNLRSILVKEIGERNIMAQLQSRKMQKKEEFRLYFQSFVEELGNGYMNKRIILKKDGGSESSSEIDDNEEWENL